MAKIPKKEEVQDQAINEAADQKAAAKSDKEVADLLNQQGFGAQDANTAVNQSNQTNQVGEDPFFMGANPDPNNEVLAPPESGQELELPSPEAYEAGLQGNEAPMPEMATESELPQEEPQQELMPEQQFGNQPQQSPALNTDMIHQIAEKVVYEKWDELMGSMGDIVIWKNSVERDLKSVKQELLRVSARVDNVQNSVLGKVKEYGDSLSTVGSEIEALENVLSKIIEPLTSNIKELDKITKKLKK